jgi:hypothetical protein
LQRQDDLLKREHVVPSGRRRREERPPRHGLEREAWRGGVGAFFAPLGAKTLNFTGLMSAC